MEISEIQKQVLLGSTAMVHRLFVLLALAVGFYASILYDTLGSELEQARIRADSKSQLEAALDALEPVLDLTSYVTADTSLLLDYVAETGVYTAIPGIAFNRQGLVDEEVIAKIDPVDMALVNQIFADADLSDLQSYIDVNLREVSLTAIAEFQREITGQRSKFSNEHQLKRIEAGARMIAMTGGNPPDISGLPKSLYFEDYAREHDSAGLFAEKFAAATQPFEEHVAILQAFCNATDIEVCWPSEIASELQKDELIISQLNANEVQRVEFAFVPGGINRSLVTRIGPASLVVFSLLLAVALVRRQILEKELIDQVGYLPTYLRDSWLNLGLRQPTLGGRVLHNCMIALVLVVFGASISTCIGLMLNMWAVDAEVNSWVVLSIACCIALFAITTLIVNLLVSRLRCDCEKA